MKKTTDEIQLTARVCLKSSRTLIPIGCNNLKKKKKKKNHQDNDENYIPW